MSESSAGQLDYRQYLSLDRSDSLRLGIGGHDEPANAERLALAQRLLHEHGRIEDAAYASAHWSQEPDVPKPFGLELIIKHQGDILAAVEDDGIRSAVRDHLGYRPGEELINDEGGQRWVWFDGGGTDPYIQAMIDAALIELKGNIHETSEMAKLQDIAKRWNAYGDEINEKAATWADYDDVADDDVARRLNG